MHDTISYNQWLEQHNLLTRVRNFPKSQRQVSLSDEAYEGLLKLAETFTTDDGNTRSSAISRMLESLGLNQLTINKPVELSLNNITTIECYAAGEDDAKEGREPNFQLIFGEMPREFQEAYRRGYLEHKK